MITELDEVKAQNTFDMIDASSLEPKTKADLKESVEEAKLNLNGRTLEERCASIARNQFDTTRFLAEIIIQFKNVADEVKTAQGQNQKRTWKDVVAEMNWWPLTVLGSVLGICAIFQPQIVGVFEAFIRLF